MLGSTIRNQQQHVGLQKLSALAGIAHSSLGPNKKFKFVQDEESEESALVGSCVRVLDSLEQTCAVGQLVHETVQAHQRVYHTGSGCLLFLAGAWSRVALECLRNGVPVPHIVSAMTEGMDVCLAVCRKCSVSTGGVGVGPSKGFAPAPPGVGPVEASQATSNGQAATKVTHKTLNTSEHRKTKLSRHFCGGPTVRQAPRPDIAHVAEGLSHGCVRAMDLVVEASRLQSRMSQQDRQCPAFDVTKVVTCVLPGLPEEHAHVSPGCVVLLHAEQAFVARHLKERHLNVALIHGDLSSTYRHLGFNGLMGGQHVCDQPALSRLSKEEEWLVKVESLLLDLEVNLVLVSGLVSDALLQRCCRRHILLVGKVTVLKEFSNTTGAVPVTYATQLSKHCVGAGVKVAVLRDLRTSVTAVNISTSGSSSLVTAVITSLVHGKLQALEDQFWACAYRVHLALQDRALLPGAGETEMSCVYHLRKRAERQVERDRQETPYRALVLQRMADSFVDYISAVMANAGGISRVTAWTLVSQRLRDCDTQGGFSSDLSPLVQEEVPRVYDNVSVKQEAWRKALDLVFLLLQTDAEVITRVDRSGDGAPAGLMLL
ncbi:chaperonin-containing T-complex member BBS12 [Aulostomus maculatus]